MPASIGSTRCTSAGPAPFFACVRCALAVLFVMGGSLAPGVGDRLSWSTRFSRRPGSRRYSVLKFNRGRDISSNLNPELVGKCLEQLKQAVSGVSQVALLWQPGAMAERTEQ